MNDKYKGIEIILRIVLIQAHISFDSIAMETVNECSIYINLKN